MYKIDDSPSVLVFKYRESEKIDAKLSNIPFVTESNPTRRFSILIRIQNPDLYHTALRIASNPGQRTKKCTV